MPIKTIYCLLYLILIKSCNAKSNEVKFFTKIYSCTRSKNNESLDKWNIIIKLKL